MRNGIPLNVYNIEVEDEHEYFANGLLVHNCDLCASMEGVVLKLDEARGLIPRHVNCRCAFSPANVGESDKGQKDTKTSIDKAIRTSQRRGGDEEDGWGSDTDISRSRPQSILDDDGRELRVLSRFLAGDHE